MKQRAITVLVLAGLALVGAAAWTYTNAKNDQQLDQAICQLGDTRCTVPMDWAPTLIASIGAVAAFAAAWALNRSTEPDSAKDLLG